MQTNKITFSIKENIPTKGTVVEETSIVQNSKYLQEVGKTVTLHKRKTRRVKVANLDKPKIVIYHYGQYKYYDEDERRFRYVTEKVPDVLGKMRHDVNTVLKSVEPALKNEMTIKYAAEQGRSLLNLTTVPSTIWRWIGLIDIDEKSYQEMENKVFDNFSGHASIDEVYDNGDAIVFITDPVNDTILHGSLEEENLTNERIEDIFKRLKGKLKDLLSVVRDGSKLYVNTIKNVFNTIKLQICIFHLIKGLLKYFMAWHRKIRNEIKANQLPRGLKTNGRGLKKFLFKNRTLFVKKRLSGKERKTMKAIIDAYPEFGQLRFLFLKFMRIFRAFSLDEAVKRLWDLLAEPLVGEKIPEVQKRLLYYLKQNELFSYLLFDKGIRTKIRTSNHTERTNRKFRKKQKTHYRIRKTVRRKKMLRMMIYFHNMKALGYPINCQLCSQFSIGLIIFFVFYYLIVRKGIVVKNQRL